jgi:hypothetical protein
MIIIVIMRFREFERRMKKAAFTFAEAALVDRESPLAGLRLNLHRWAKAGELLRIRREVYAFPGKPCSLPEMIGVLYPPAYVSLESALNQHGFLPDVPFETALVSPRATRSFVTPWGRFHFHRILPRLFFGYDPKTLLAWPEKTVLDYLYFRGRLRRATPAFWRESRLEHLESLDWRRGDAMLEAYASPRVKTLWKSLQAYAKTGRSS